MENPGYYAIIPATVRYSNITPNAKLLYGEITALSNKHGYCYASNGYFSGLYGVSKTSINNWINELIDNKFISREIVYAENSKEVVNRYLRILDHPPQENLDTSPKNLDHPPQENLEGSPKNFGYNNNTLNIPTEGVISNQNNTKILEENNQKATMEPRVPTPPRGIVAPKISAESRIPKNTKAVITEWAEYPETKEALEDYALFLMDTYNFKDTTIKNKITQICRMASNLPQGIEVICRYNIDRNYASPYKPSDYKKQIIDATVVSAEFDEDDFVRDENGNIEEVW